MRGSNGIRDAAAPPGRVGIREARYPYSRVKPLFAHETVVTSWKDPPVNGQTRIPRATRWIDPLARMPQGVDFVPHPPVENPGLRQRHPNRDRLMEVYYDDKDCASRPNAS
jgi:hypothetical protein